MSVCRFPRSESKGIENSKLNNEFPVSSVSLDYRLNAVVSFLSFDALITLSNGGFLINFLKSKSIIGQCLQDLSLSLGILAARQRNRNQETLSYYLSLLIYKSFDLHSCF